MSAQTGRGFQGESETSTFVVGSSENADINSLFDSFFLSPPHSASYDPLVESKLFKPVSFYVSQVSQVKAFELVLRAIGDSTAVDLSCLTQLRVSRQLSARALSLLSANSLNSRTAIFKKDGGTHGSEWAIPKVYAFARLVPVVETYRALIEEEKTRKKSLTTELEEARKRVLQLEAEVAVHRAAVSSFTDVLAPFKSLLMRLVAEDAEMRDVSDI